MQREVGWRCFLGGILDVKHRLADLGERALRIRSPIVTDFEESARLDRLDLVKSETLDLDQMDPSDGIDQQSVGWAGRFPGKAWFTEDGGIGVI